MRASLRASILLEDTKSWLLRLPILVEILLALLRLAMLPPILVLVLVRLRLIVLL